MHIQVCSPQSFFFRYDIFKLLLSFWRQPSTAEFDGMLSVTGTWADGPAFLRHKVFCLGQSSFPLQFCRSFTSFSRKKKEYISAQDLWSTACCSVLMSCSSVHDEHGRLPPLGMWASGACLYFADGCRAGFRPFTWDCLPFVCSFSGGQVRQQ